MITTIILALLTLLVASDEHANAASPSGEDCPQNSRSLIPPKPAAARTLRACH